MSENTKKPMLLEDKEFGKWLTKWSVITVCLIVAVFVGTFIIKDIITPDPITVKCEACGATVEAKQCENCGLITPKDSTCPACYTTTLMFGCPGCDNDETTPPN